MALGAADPPVRSEAVMLGNRLALVVPDGVDLARLDGVLSDADFSVERRYPFSPVWQVAFEERAADALPRQVERLRGVLAAAGLGEVAVAPDHLFFPSAKPNDTRYGDQWYLETLRAPEAWDIATGSADVVVAVIDSGLFLEENGFDIHNDFRTVDGPNIWVNPGEDLDEDGVLGDADDLNGVDDDGNGLVDDLSGWDFQSDDNIADDLFGHGNEVAGLVGAAGDNQFGIAGAAWRVGLLPLKAGDADFPWSALAACLDYAVSLRQAGAPLKILTNAYGANELAQVDVMRDAVRRTWEAGLLFVAAAGNGNVNLDQAASTFIPAGYDFPNIIAVASTDEDDFRDFDSNYGLHSVDLGAPGTNLLTLDNFGAFGTVDGTSFATSLVAGVAALILARYPDFDYIQLREILFHSVQPLEALDGLVATGGRVDAGAALALADALDSAYAWWRWEFASAFNGGVSSEPEDDPDGDGFSNLEEFVLNTHPADGLGFRAIKPRVEIRTDPPEGLEAGIYTVVRVEVNGRALETPTLAYERLEFADPLAFAPASPAETTDTVEPANPGERVLEAWFPATGEPAAFFRVQALQP